MMYSVPSSIGNLQNLETLYLGCAENLQSIPEGIGRLTRLKFLYLRSSNITSLSPFVGRLQKLEHLDLEYAANLTVLPDEIVGLTSLKRFIRSKSVPRSPPDEFKYKFLCKRAKKRLWTTMNEFSLQTSKLWPHILENAPEAFNDDLSVDNYPSSTIKVANPDAIYQLLSNGRESFINVLLLRKQ